MERKRKALSLWLITVLSVALSAALVTAVCTVIFATVYKRELTRDAQLSAEQSVGQAAAAVNNYLELMKKKLTVVSDTVNACKTADDMEERISAITKIESDIYAVTLYDENGKIINCTGSGGKLKAEIYKDLSFDKALFDTSGDFALSAPHVQTLFEGEYPWVVTLARKTDNSALGGAYIAMDISFFEIAQYIDGISIGRHGYCFVTDSRGNIVYHPQQQLLFSGLKTENTSFLAALSDGVHKEGNALYMLSTTSDGRWRVAGISFTDSLISERRGQIIISVALSALCCAAIAGITLLIYLKLVNAPVRRLMRAMRDFEKDAANFSFSGGDIAVSEISELSYSFGHMSKKIKELMEQIKKDETALRRTELRALQAQINPHFLYNTLDSINWRAKAIHADDISQICTSLGSLLRITLHKDMGNFTVGEEMQLVSNYMTIQHMRYPNKLIYHCDVSENLYTISIPKFTIQPLVENAIRYSLMNAVDICEVSVTAFVSPDQNGSEILTVRVKNNGSYFEDNILQKLQNGERQPHGFGIGLLNVLNRLQITYGDPFGLQVYNEYDEYDTYAIAEIRIPAVSFV